MDVWTKTMENLNNPDFENVCPSGGKVRNRRLLILSLLRDKRTASNSELSAILGISEVSIRKDMEFLEKRGYVKRFHGGASLSEDTFVLFDLSLKRMTNRAVKQQIALEAAKLVDKPGLCIFIDTGSTNLLLARSLKRDLPVTVVTNSFSTITALEGRPHYEVLTLGGLVDYKNRVFLGPWADTQIERFRFDFVFTGADSVSCDGFGSNDLVQGELLRKAIKRAEKSYVLADSSKVGKRASSIYAKPSEVTAWITDAAVDRAFVESFSSQKGTVLVTNPG